jgi:hypothetical protein
MAHKEKDNMNVGIVAPIKMLNKYCKGGIQYCIPMWLLENDDYFDFYGRKSLDGNSLVIMDTKHKDSRRQPEDEDVIIDAGEALKPDMVITPSVAFNKDKTIAEFLKFRNSDWGSSFMKEGLIGCLEGATLEEVISCAEEMRLHVGYYGVASHLLSFIGEGLKIAKPIVYIDNRTSPWEISLQKGDIIISSLPVRLGLCGRLNSNHLPSPPPLDLLEDKDNYPTITTQNVDDFISHFKEV